MKVVPFTAQDRQVLRIVAQGTEPVRAVEVAKQLGWNPRVGGPRLRSLERRGLVKREVMRPATVRTEALNGWVLTDRGRVALGE